MARGPHDGMLQGWLGVWSLQTRRGEGGASHTRAPTQSPPDRDEGQVGAGRGTQAKEAGPLSSLLRHSLRDPRLVPELQTSANDLVQINSGGTGKRSPGRSGSSEQRIEERRVEKSQRKG